MSKYNLDFYRDRLKTRGWSQVIDDDKYYSDHDLMDSFPCFAHYAFSYLGLPALSTVQLEIVGFLEDKKMQYPHKLVQAGRGQGKSILSQVLVVWYLLNNPDEKILIVSAGSQRAANYTQFVKKLLELFPITRPMKPVHNKQRTSTTSFDVAGAMASDSPSVYATGIGGQITGMRSTKLIFDDIESHLTVQSVSLTERVLHSMNEAFNLLMSGHDHAIFLATPHSVNSIYIDLMDKGTKGFIVPSMYPVDDSVYLGGLAPFISKAIKDNPAIVGSSVDERLDLEFLNNKKTKIGKSNFKLQYMLDVSDSDTLRHPLKLSDFIVMDVDDDSAPLKVHHSSMPDKQIYMKHNGFKADKFYSPAYVSEEVGEYEMKLMSVDPAGLGGDEVGVTIIYSLNTRLFIKKVIGFKGGYQDENLVNIATLCDIHKIDTLVIEKNFGSGMFANLLEPHIRKISPSTQVEDLQVTGQKEIRIIESLEAMLNQHRLIIDKGTLDKDILKPVVNSFTYQMCKISRERGSLRADDIVDSLSNAVIFIQEFMSNNEDYGMTQHKEDQGQANLDFTLNFMNQFGKEEKRIENYSTNF